MMGLVHNISSFLKDIDNKKLVHLKELLKLYITVNLIIDCLYLA